MIIEKIEQAAVEKIETKTVNFFKYLGQLLKTKNITIVVKDEQGRDYPIKLQLCVNKKGVEKQLNKVKKALINVPVQTRNKIDLGDTYLNKKTGEPIGYEIREILSRERFLPNIPKANWEKYLPLLREQSLPLKVLMGSNWDTTLNLRHNANKKVDQSRELLEFQRTTTLGKMKRKEKKAFKALEFWVNNVSNKLDFTNAKIYLTKVYKKEQRALKKANKNKNSNKNLNLNFNFR